MAGASWIFFALFIVTAAMLAWQITTIERTNGPRSLMLFKSNHWLGLALTAAFVIEGLF
jgi:4-hydroxybenzoate polyprenyltransferase